jgi:hypothetical protein
MKQVPFLSYVILEEGIFVGSSRTQNVLSLDTPTTVTNSRIFLGLVRQCQKIMEGFSKTIKPITELLGRDKKFNWIPAHEV